MIITSNKWRIHKRVTIEYSIYDSLMRIPMLGAAQPPHFSRQSSGRARLDVSCFTRVYMWPLMSKIQVCVGYDSLCRWLIKMYIQNIFHYDNISIKVCTLDPGPPPPPPTHTLECMRRPHAYSHFLGEGGIVWPYSIGKIPEKVWKRALQMVTNTRDMRYILFRDGGGGGSGDGERA